MVKEAEPSPVSSFVELILCPSPPRLPAPQEGGRESETPTVKARSCTSTGAESARGCSRPECLTGAISGDRGATRRPGTYPSFRHEERVDRVPRGDDRRR